MMVRAFPHVAACDAGVTLPMKTLLHPLLFGLPPDRLCQSNPNVYLTSMVAVKPFFDAPVSLEECLKDYCIAEEMTGENMYYCENCKEKRNARSVDGS